MDLDWGFEVVDQLESHWHGRLRPRLTGLTDDEYFWQPVPGCWTIRSNGEGGFTMDFAKPPLEREPVTTIAWRLAHLIDVFGSPKAPRSGTATGALRQLDEGHDAWIRNVRNLGNAGLAQPQGDRSPPDYADAPMARLVMYTHVEVIHHGAEICLLRDLYQWGPQGTR